MNSGVYLLFIQLPQEESIQVGSLGKFDFSPGLYCYVGSGMNGLDKRVERHRGDEKKKHWHIDYFLEHGNIIGALKLRTGKELECELNRHISRLSRQTPVRGFGSSDCDCEAHFHLL